MNHSKPQPTQSSTSSNQFANQSTNPQRTMQSQNLPRNECRACLGNPPLPASSQAYLIRIKFIPPNSFLTTNRQNDPNFHLTMNVSNFKPEEISVKADVRNITIKADREERVDEDGSLASYHFVRQVATPPGVDIRFIESWVLNNILNIRVPFISTRYERGTPIPVDITLPNRNAAPRYPNGLQKPRIKKSGPPNVMELKPAFRNMTQPGCSTWSFGVDGSILQKPQEPTRDTNNSELDTEDQDELEISRGLFDSVIEERFPSAEDSAKRSNTNNSLEDLSYELVNHTKSDSDNSDDDSSHSSDG